MSKHGNRFLKKRKKKEQMENVLKNLFKNPN